MDNVCLNYSKFIKTHTNKVMNDVDVKVMLGVNAGFLKNFFSDNKTVGADGGQVLRSEADEKIRPFLKAELFFP